MVVISEAAVVWSLLRGLVCVYKPAGVSAYDVRHTLVANLAADLCKLQCRPPVTRVSIEGEVGAALRVVTTPSYADHPLVVGPRYQPRDLRCAWATYLGRNTSGVMVVGINEDVASARKLHAGRPVRTYQVKGQLGEATDTFFSNGKVVERATFRHVRQSTVDAYLASLQASHQRTMFERMGVDLSSQMAYDLAVQGLVRPRDGKIPIIYGIKCVHFKPPDFTLEVHCVNECEHYLLTLVHELGLRLRTAATCTSIRCIRYGAFDVELALLRKHWRLQHILDNVAACRRALRQCDHLAGRTSPALVREQPAADASTPACSL